DCAAEKSAAQRVIYTAPVQGFEELRDILRAVLAVRVECNDTLGALPQRIVDPGLERRALPEIDPVAQHGRSGSLRNVCGSIARTVVDDNDFVAEARHVADNARDSDRLVIGSDHDEDW